VEWKIKPITYFKMKDYQPTAKEIKGMGVCARTYSLTEWLWLWFKANTICKKIIDRDIDMRIKSREKI
jgi:hypothetical protein